MSLISTARLRLGPSNQTSKPSRTTSDDDRQAGQQREAQDQQRAASPARAADEVGARGVVHRFASGFLPVFVEELDLDRALAVGAREPHVEAVENRLPPAPHACGVGRPEDRAELAQAHPRFEDAVHSAGGLLLDGFAAQAGALGVLGSRLVAVLPERLVDLERIARDLRAVVVVAFFDRGPAPDERSAGAEQARADRRAARGRGAGAES